MNIEQELRAINERLTQIERKLNAETEADTKQSSWIYFGKGFLHINAIMLMALLVLGIIGFLFN